MYFWLLPRQRICSVRSLTFETFPAKNKNNKKQQKNKRKQRKKTKKKNNKEKTKKKTKTTKKKNKKPWKPILENVPKLTNILLSHVQLRDFWTKENSKVQLAFKRISFWQKKAKKNSLPSLSIEPTYIIDQKSSALPTELLEHYF